VEERSPYGYYTPAQAAHILRLTPTRVRQLLQNGELEGARDEAGHWSIPDRVVHERLERLRRESYLEAVGYDPSSGREKQELIDELRDRVRSLEHRLGEGEESRRRADTIIAQLTQANVALNERLRELEAPAPHPGVSESREEPSESAAEAAPGRLGGKDASATSAQPFTEKEPPGRRSWWREFFGFGQ
jgi:hypothetical protein